MHDLLLSLVPPGSPDDFVLILAKGDSIASALRSEHGFGHIAEWAPGEYDLESDFYPYPNAHFKAVVCRDLLDELTRDPMHMMDEIHRVVRPGCHVILSTRRFSEEQIVALLVNCGLEVVGATTSSEGVAAAGKKVGPMRNRYPQWLYPGR